MRDEIDYNTERPKRENRITVHFTHTDTHTNSLYTTLLMKSVPVVNPD